MRSKTVLCFLLLSLAGMAQGTWTQLPPLPAAGRFQIACFNLNNKAYVGCGSWPVRYDLWEFNPASSVWTQKMTFPGTGRGFGYSFSIGAKGYYGGGSDGWNNLNDHWEYDANTNLWTQRATFPGGWPSEPYAFTINGKGFIGGGGIGNDCWEYDPVSDSWTQKMSTPGGVMGAVDRGAFVIGNIGFVVNSINELWQYDPSLNSWTQRAAFPGTARYGGVGTGFSCMGLFGLGSGPNNLPDMWLYHYPTDSWIQQTNVPVPPRCDAAAVTINGEGYLFCGDSYSDAWKFTPPNCSGLLVSANATATPCNVPNGTATANVVNGTPPFSYLWIPGNQTTQTATGLSQGMYTVTVTDANSLTGTTAVFIPAPYTIILNTFSSNAPCNTSNGQASVVPSGGAAPYSYSWSNGATTQIATGLAQGTYSVIVTDANGCSNYAYVIVGMHQGPPPLSAFGDTIICSGQSTFLSAIFQGYQQYTWLWSTGWNGTGVTVSPTSTTSYTVSASNGNCTTSDSITVYVLPSVSVNVSGDDSICMGQTTTLNASGNAPTYLWSTGGTDASITIQPMNSQTFFVVGNNSANCPDTAFIYINVFPGPTSVITPSVSSFQTGQTITLYGSGGGSYTWSNGATTDSIQVTLNQSQTYCLTVTDANGCTNSTCMALDVGANCELFIPTAFSPDKNNLNETWRIIDPCLKNVRVLVYDRWGKKVFESNDRNFEWDGTYNGAPLDAAVFTYYISGTLINGKSFSQGGKLTLVR